MNRRLFLRNAATALIAAPVLFSRLGCNDSAENILNTVLASAYAILGVIEPNATWLSEYQAAVTALESAEQQWKAGGAVTVVINALETLATIAAVIPITEPYASLIAVLVAGIEAVLASLGYASAVKGARNPYMGRAQLNKPHVFQSHAGAYKNQWNSTALSAGLPQAQIH